ncbi:hypothetical protein SLL00_03640 [Metabacillus indicus]|uniref:hypothetical protein n=1 Tax=Metabacillus indicus TaxID=246786 RepID=UPI002A02D825|nr:hypothetical protein [Metabacillus indicus]MDX8288867.1 hypothetical protein [Metabacillus indicus]
MKKFGLLATLSLAAILLVSPLGDPPVGKPTPVIKFAGDPPVGIKFSEIKA